MAGVLDLHAPIDDHLRLRLGDLRAADRSRRTAARTLHRRRRPARLISGTNCEARKTSTTSIGSGTSASLG
jgi:hypothetical protein